MLSKRAQNLKPSPTLFLVAKARELQSQGLDVISLTVGEPDWATYPAAAEAGIEAIRKGITKYTPANGTLELRKAIVAATEKDIGQTYTVQQVAVTSGAKYAIFAALQVICDETDEVIIHSPYWVSYPVMVELAGAKPVLVTCTEETNFKITPEMLKKSITPNTKAFLFCSPANPTGFVYSAAELKALADVIRQHPRMVVITDDMYNRLMFDGSRCAPHILQVAPDLKDRTIVINGGSKAYSMTGWRIGWAMGPQAVIQSLGDYASQSTGAPSSISQHAAVQAITSCEANIAETCKTLIKRMADALEVFKKIPEFKVYKPDGAFYFWVDVRGALGKSYAGQKILSSKDLCLLLLEKFHVATVPGEEFGNPGFMRLSFAIGSERMAEAIGRMRKMLDEMQ